jgi:hypothetical protein
MKSAAKKQIATTFDELPTMLSLEDIATHLHVHRETVRRFRRDGLHNFPKGLRLRGLVRIPRREYERWLNSLLEEDQD